MGIFIRKEAKNLDINPNVHSKKTAKTPNLQETTGVSLKMKPGSSQDLETSNFLEMAGIKHPRESGR